MAIRLIIVFFIVSAFYSNIFSHCEIPCGIYNDSLRIQLMKEHALTIEKSITSIQELKKAKEPNLEQIVRWVNNKEDHANKIQEIASQYFLTQRVKIPEISEKNATTSYQAQLSALHEIIVMSMKAKQNTDLAYVKKIKEAIAKYEKAASGHSHTK